MKIAFFTNTYLPMVGGVAESVERFRKELLAAGHDVLVVAPSYQEQCDDPDDVIRIPAVQHFNGSDFSVALPLEFDLASRVEGFDPDLIHSHHPFLLGNTALRMAARLDRPMVYTYHTMYEHYTHYVPLELPRMRAYAKQLAAGYANLCEHILAPSESVREILRDRGVRTPISVAPTGVDVREYRHGDGRRFRREHDIPSEVPLIGHVGRLAPEKNLDFLGRSVTECLRRRDDASFLLVGDGPSRAAVREQFQQADQTERLLDVGVLRDRDLVDAYHAMDVFAFASKTETQGMVLVEAMAAGTPVAALDAPGSREVVRDGVNGRLIPREQVDAFADGLEELLSRAVGSAEEQQKAHPQSLPAAARETAEQFSTQRCAARLMEVYRRVCQTGAAERSGETFTQWDAFLDSIRREWDLWVNQVSSATEAIRLNGNGTE